MGKRGQDVQAALSQAAALREKARSTSDPGRWSEARALAKRAEGLLESGPVDPALVTQVRALLSELDADEKDRRMLDTLEGIRLRQAQVKEGAFDIGAAGPLYAEAFREYGIDVEALPVADAAERVRQSAIREELLASLDYWSRPKVAKDESLQSHLRLVADAADDDGWRRSLRQAVEAKDNARLKELSRDAAALKQSPTVLRLLGEALDAAGMSDEAATFFRQAQQRYPADFWLNHNLAYTLMRLGPSGERQAIGYYRA